MYFFEHTRRIFFWLIDLFTGSNVKRHFIDVKYINENHLSSKSKKNRENYLINLLSHAKQNVKFYENINKDSKFEEFPVINKNIIKRNFDDFLINKNIKKLYKVTTSGTSGQPFSVFFNKNKKNRNTADTIYFSQKSGFEIGNKLYYLRSWGENYKKSRLEFLLQNIYDHSVFDLKDADVNILLDKIQNDTFNIGIIAYATSFERICKYLDSINSKPLKTNVRSIILIAESLNDYTKKSTKKYFGITPLSRYSNSENGIMAQQEEHSIEFMINWASYYVEILNIDNDSSVGFGKLGRIVVTDLFNYSMPMIRYDTGDLGIMTQENKKYLPLLSNIEGRKLDMIFNTKGELISSYIIIDICSFEGVNQYQLIQKGTKDYVFKVNVSKGFVEKALIEYYKEKLGVDANIIIEYVDEIPLLNSGKRKLVVNEMLNKN